MVLPDLGPGLWFGIAFGIFGVAFWIGGLVVFNYLLNRFHDEPSSEE